MDIMNPNKESCIQKNNFPRNQVFISSIVKLVLSNFFIYSAIAIFLQIKLDYLHTYKTYQ